ncbi:MAG TPA: hypothetical protein VME69_12130 [Methylocella sp.]|nr:hypothetical protein [Methylocella sp.]
MVSLFASVYGIYPWRHDVAIVFGATAIIAGAYEAFSVGKIAFVYWLSLSIVVLVSAISLYLYVGPNLPEETDTVGWLMPANDASPIGYCVKHPAPKDALLFFLGPNEAWTTSQGLSKIIQVGDCTSLSLVRENNRMRFVGDVFGTNGELVARLTEDNKFRLIPGEYAYRERSDDRSKLTIFDKRGEQLLMIHFMNSKTIRIEGNFICSDGTKAIISKSEMLIHNTPADEFHIKHACMSDIKSPNQAVLTIKRDSVEIGGGGLSSP